MTRYAPAPIMLRSFLRTQVPDVDDVGSPSVEYLDMAVRWELPEDLLGGTLAMRAAGEKWLPRETNEKWENYLVRLDRAILFNGYGNAISRCVGKPFSRPVTIAGKTSDLLDGMCKNLDKQGNDLTHFAKQLMKDGVHFGLCHFIVDYPQTGGEQTLADEKTGITPFFTRICPKSVIGWRSELDERTGEEYLTMVRVKDTIIRKTGKYGTESVDRVRVFEPGLTTTYERTQTSKQYNEVSSTPILVAGKKPTRINLVTAYFNYKGLLQAAPPLEDLAWVNQAWWASAADQRNYLRFVRIGILFGKGWTPDEAEKGIDITPSMARVSSSSGATLEYVEHGGNAIQAGERDLKDLEQKMEVLGTQPLIERSAQSTATGKALDENSNDSMVQAWVRTLETALEHGFKLAADFAKETLDEDFGVNIYNEFALAVTAGNDITNLIALRQAVPPLISAKTALEEIKRRGLVNDDVDVDDELDRINEEMMSAQPTDPNSFDPQADPNEPPAEGGGNQDPKLDPQSDPNSPPGRDAPGGAPANRRPGFKKAPKPAE